MNLEHVHKISDTYSVRLIYVDICDDLIAGILLSQIVYWSMPDRYGQSRLRVQHDGHYWIAKRRTDWKDEIRISPKQYDRAILKLQQLGFVTSKVFKFGASTMVHVRILKTNIEKAVDSHLSSELPKGEIENYPKGNTGIAERGIPSYTENTNRDYDTPEKNHDDSKDKFKVKTPDAAVAYLNEKLAPGYAGKFLSLIADESRHWSFEVVKHLIDRITEDPSKPTNYYKKVIDNWAKIKPTPTTAAEILEADKKKVQKQAESKGELITEFDESFFKS